MKLQATLDWVIIIVTLAVVGALDWVTGYELNFVAFYFFPIYWAASRQGYIAATCVAISSAALWCFVDVASGHQYSSVFFLVWNALMRLFVFLLIGALMGRAADLHCMLQEYIRRLHQASANPSAGIAPPQICMRCGKVSGANGQWLSLDAYRASQTSEEAYHCCCPECLNGKEKG